MPEMLSGWKGKMELDTIVVGDCLDVMAEMPDGCVDLIFADPPHNKGLADWDKDHDWRSWIPEVLRILKPNGALWVDHSDIDEIMAISRCIVESGGPKRLNFIVWDKFNVSLKDRWAFNGIWESPSLRSWPQMAEYLIYHASEEAWKQQGFVFEPLKRWFNSEWKRSGLTRAQVDIACGTSNVTQYWFLERNYQIPTAGKYAILNELAPNYFLRNYEDLRAEYKDLRYTFNGPPGSGSIWPIPAWNHEADWHPTPKPEALLMRIIEKTSNEGDLVFDPFMGSGTTAVAALRLGRYFYGCDISEEYVKRANGRVEKIRLEMAQMSFLSGQKV